MNEDDKKPTRRTGRRFAFGMLVGVAIALGLNFAVTLVPYRLPEPAERDFATSRRGAGGTGVSISFVTTGTARVPARRLHHGAGLGRRDVAFRAALIRHPDGTLLFGTGVDPEGPDGLVFDPFGRVDEPRAPEDLPPIDRIIAPTPRWIHLGGAETWPSIADQPVQIGQGDLWQARRGPWPRRYGIDRSRIDALGDRLQRIVWQRRNRFGFAETYDLYDDRSVLMVRLRGSTIDEVGLLVTVDSGDRYMLVGDAVWTEAQVTERFPRPPWSTWLLDRNRMQLAGTQTRLFQLWRDHDVRVVPMLDGEIDLPEFPARWE